MFKTIEPNIKVGSRQVLVVDSSKGTKKNSKGGFRNVSKKATINKKDNTKSDDPCCHCRMKGHWMMNCKLISRA